MDDFGCRPDRSRIAFFVKVDYCLALALGSFASHLPLAPSSPTNHSVNLEFIFARHSFRPWKNFQWRGRVWGATTHPASEPIAFSEKPKANTWPLPAEPYLSPQLDSAWQDRGMSLP